MIGLPNYPDRVAMLRRRREQLELLVRDLAALSSLLRQKAQIHERQGKPTKFLLAEAESYSSIGGRLTVDLAQIEAWLSDPLTDESLPEILF